MPGPLEPDAVADRLRALPGWERVGDGIERNFVFGDFPAAFGFMASSAAVAW